jgi:hypothetical protein
VDWSGLTSVWVCQCGHQGFGGFTRQEGIWAAQKHWTRVHGEGNVPTPWFELLPCAWSSTPWGEARNESCDRTEQLKGLCKTHYQRDLTYNKRGGMCSLEGCHVAKAEDSDLCKTHLNQQLRLGEEARIREVKLRSPVRLTEAPGKPGPVRVLADPIELSPGRTHGTRAGYAAGCRCRPCSDAQSAYRAENRRQRLSRGGAS